MADEWERVGEACEHDRLLVGRELFSQQPNELPQLAAASFEPRPFTPRMRIHSLEPGPARVVSGPRAVLGVLGDVLGAVLGALCLGERTHLWGEVGASW